MPDLTAKARPGKTHRLRDIVTQSVDIVDHAANRRKFLVRKQHAASSVKVPTLVDLESSEPARDGDGVEYKETEAGRELNAALESVRAAAAKFDTEPNPIALVQEDLLIEVEELTARLRGREPGQPPQTEPVMDITEKAKAIETTLQEIAEAIKGGGVDEEKLSGTISSVAALANGLKQKTSKAKKDKGPSILSWVSEKAKSLSQRIEAGKIGRREVNEIKRLSAVMRGIMDRYTTPTSKSVEEVAELTTAATEGDVSALASLFEEDDHAYAKGAMEELERTVTDAEQKLQVAEAAATPPAVVATPPTVEPAGTATPPPSAPAPMVAPVPAPVAAVPAPAPVAPAPVVAVPAPVAPVAPVAPAPAVPAPEVTALETEKKKLEEELAKARADLVKALETPGERASRGDPLGGEPPPTDQLLFPTDYNDPIYRAALAKADRQF